MDRNIGTKQPPRSFGGSRRGAPEPQDEFPGRVVIPAMVLKPVELPVVLTVDQDELGKCVKAVRDAFTAAAMQGIEDAIRQWSATLVNGGMEAAVDAVENKAPQAAE